MNVSEGSGTDFVLYINRILELVSMRLNDFGIQMDTGLVALTTDGAPAMKKLGRISHLEQQLCLAHGIQLAVIDTLYERPCKGRLFDADEDDEDLLSSDEGESGAEDDDDALEVESQLLSNDFASGQMKDAINAVRKLTKIFTPGNKNDKLQEYVRQANNGNELQLKLDCKTRWSSLYDMLLRYWRIRDCIEKALIDVKSDFRISSVQNYVISCLLKALEPVHTTVLMLCRRECNLLDARIALKFMLETLQIQDNPVGRRLFSRLTHRISERWTINASLLYYLTHGNTVNDDLSIICDVEQKFEFELQGISSSEVLGDFTDMNDSVEINDIFAIPKKKILADHIHKLLSRMGISTDEADLNEDIDGIDDISSKRFKSYEEVLNFKVKGANSKKCRPGGTLTGLSKVIHQEMTNFEKSHIQGVHLKKCHDMLMTIKPTSVESERSFSAGGYFCSKIRSKLAPSTIDTLCFLRHFIKNNSTA